MFVKIRANLHCADYLKIMYNHGTVNLHPGASSSFQLKPHSSCYPKCLAKGLTQSRYTVLVSNHPCWPSR